MKALLVATFLGSFYIWLTIAQIDAEVCLPNKTNQNRKDFHADPDDCHFYLQCFYYNETTALAIRQPCPPYHFWSDKVLNCVPESATFKCQDPCYVSNKSCYAEAGRCSSYYVCSNGVSYRSCCPPGTAFHQAKCSCIADEQCSEACNNTAFIEPLKGQPQIIDAERAICRDSSGNLLQADESDPRHFYTFQASNVQISRMACAENTLFDVDSCSCSIHVEATPNPSNQVDDGCLLKLPFDVDMDDHSNHKFLGFKIGKKSEIKVQKGVLVLDGKGYVEYPGLKSVSFNGQASWCFLYRCPEDGCRSDGAILSNHGCESTEAFSIKVLQRSNGTIEAHVAFDQPKRFVKLTAVSQPVDSFNQVCVIVVNDTASLLLDSSLVDSERLDPGSIIRTGHCPLLIGFDGETGHFKGFVDEVVVCRRATTFDSSLNLRTYAGGDGPFPTPRETRRTTTTTTRNPTSPTTTAARPTTPEPVRFCAHVAWRGVGWLPEPVNFQVSPTSTIANRIIGGVEVAEGESPWTVRLNTDGQICTGTLIDPQWVLTAASCIDVGANTNILIDIGFSSRYAEKGTAFRGYSLALRPCNYTFGYDEHLTVLPYNVALVRLDEPVELSPKIKPARLPLQAYCEPDSSSLSRKTIDYCEQMVVAGWGSPGGRDNYGGYEFGTNLTKLHPVFLTTRDECEYIYDVNLADHQFCAGTPDMPAAICEGDLGAAAICTKAVCDDAACRSNALFVVGIAGWRARGCNSSYPSGYTRTCSVLPWIKAATKHFAKMQQAPTTPPPPPSTTPLDLCSYIIRPGQNWQTTSVNYGSNARQTVLLSERIMGGVAVQDDSRSKYPWMALVKIRHNSTSFKICGGALINSQWILTSAACLKQITNSSKVDIVLGSTKPFGTPQPGSVTLGFSVAVRHCQQDDGYVMPYNKPHHLRPYNIAMVKLSQKVNFTGFIQPIAMADEVGACKGPPASDWVDWADGCKKVLLAGWGELRPGSGYSENLQKSESRIITRQRCELMLRTSERGASFFPKFDQHFCTWDSASNSYTLEGDDGGPAVCTELANCDPQTNNAACHRMPYLVGIANYVPYRYISDDERTAILRINSRICPVDNWIKQTLNHF